jgi:O-antigen/teichoic acid export membrane protein
MLYGFDQYAIYHATKMLARPIQLITETMDYYTLPRLAIRPAKTKMKKYINESLFVAGILGALYILWGNSIFRTIYAGKFGTQKSLLLLLALLELIILIQTPLANCLQAAGENKQLWKIGITSIIFIISIWCIYAVINRFVGLPMALLPIGVGVVFIARASFIYSECKDI